MKSGVCEIQITPPLPLLTQAAARGPARLIPAGMFSPAFYKASLYVPVMVSSAPGNSSGRDSFL